MSWSITRSGVRIGVMAVRVWCVERRENFVRAGLGLC